MGESKLDLRNDELELIAAVVAAAFELTAVHGFTARKVRAEGICKANFAIFAWFLCFKEVKDFRCNNVASYDSKIRWSLFLLRFFNEFFNLPSVFAGFDATDDAVARNVVVRYLLDCAHRVPILFVDLDQLADGRNFVRNNIVAKEHGNRLVDADKRCGGENSMAITFGGVLADKGEFCEATDFLNCLEFLEFLFLFQAVLKFEVAVKMILQRTLADGGHENNFFDACGNSLFHNVLNDRLVDDRQHFLRLRLGGGEEPRAHAGNGDDRFANLHSKVSIAFFRDDFCYTFCMESAAYGLRNVIHDVAMFIRPYRGRFLFATFCRLCADIAWLYPAYALASAVTFLSAWTPGDLVTPLYTILLYWAGAVVIRVGGQYLARTRGFAAIERAQLDAKSKAIEHLYHLDIAWHELENAGNKLKRIERGAESIDKLGRIWINNLIEIFVVLSGIVVIMATIDPLVAIASAVFIVTFYALSRQLLKRASAAAREVNAKEEELSGVLFEGVNNIRTAKVLNMTASLMKIVRRVSQEVMERVTRRIARFQMRNAVLGLWANGFRIAMLLVIAHGIFTGHYEVGFLLLFYGYFNRVQESVTELSDVVETYVTSKYAIGRMMEILALPVYKNGAEGKREFPKQWKTLSLKNVGFSYGGEQVLRNVSFTIHRGERVGVVGVSGAGKSTLFKLLLKENESYTGEICVDDIPLRKIKKTSYYQHATVVLQETEVFNFSLRENITIANPARASDERAFTRALDIAHVTPFLTRLPNGVETLIGEKGVKLSGGERQRVGIARAVFKEPDILFLDEATSHLDLESEEKIRDSLHVFFQKVTAVVIAHRLTTIKEMDRILVIDKGDIIENGTFDELYARRGRFYELWEKQKLS